MTITYPLALPPSRVPRRIVFDPVNIVGVNVSDYTAEAEIQEWPGKFWKASFEYPILRQPEHDDLHGILMALHGPVGTFYLGDPLRTSPRGSFAGAPVVNGTNSPKSKILNLRGFTPSQSNVIRAKDIIQVGTGVTQRIYSSLFDVDSDVSGNASVDIWPTIREELSDGDAIVTTSTQGVFRLIQNSVPESAGVGGFYDGIRFQAVEAL